MKDWLCKEYVVKRKRWAVIIDIIFESIIIGWLLYCLLYDCSDAIAWYVTEVKKNDAVLESVFIMMPMIVIAIGTFKFGFYLCNDSATKAVSFNTKQEKSTKVAKTTKTTKKTKKR